MSIATGDASRHALLAQGADRHPHRRSAGFTRADIVHALSVDLERDRELRVFRQGSVSPEPGRIARRVAHAGLGMVGLGAALSFVESINPVVGLGAVGYGIVVAMTASVIALLYTRRRRNLSGEWWLKFWQSPAGACAARVAGLGLERPPLAAPQAQEIGRRETPSVELHPAPSRIQRVREWLEASHGFETNERD